MTYEKARDDAQQKDLEDWTRLFIEKYKDTTLTHTVFLFPGGTGSVLKRSRAEYEEGDVLDPSTFKTVWLNCYTLMGAALTLRMKRTEAGLYKEVDGHVVIASGTLREDATEQKTHVLTVKLILHGHMFIMEARATHLKLADALGVVSVRARKPEQRVQIASRPAALDFIESLRAHFKDRLDNPLSIAQAEINAFVESYWQQKQRSLRSMLAVARRILIDLNRPPAAARTNNGKVDSRAGSRPPPRKRRSAKKVSSSVKRTTGGRG